MKDQWTVITLKKHFEQRLSDKDLRDEQRFEAQSKAVEAALEAQKTAVAIALTGAEKAVTKAETAAEKRFDSVNEFRSQLKDQAGTFVTRSEIQIMTRFIITSLIAISGIIIAIIIKKF